VGFCDFATKQENSKEKSTNEKKQKTKTKKMFDSIKSGLLGTPKEPSLMDDLGNKCGLSFKQVIKVGVN
jgi:hypothetical protein